MDYKPPTVRYVISVYDIEELDKPIREFTDQGELIVDNFLIRYANCDAENVTYNPKDYHHTSEKCTPIESYTSGYNWASKLVDLNYWRRM